MCGRYASYTPVEILAQQLGAQVRTSDPGPRYNISPTLPVIACRLSPVGDVRELIALRWGLIPPWAKDPRIGNRMINARAETLQQKPAFRSAFRHRRCLLPADGFYEWTQTPSGKQPWFIRNKSGKPFMFAGLWESWADRHGSTIESCTVVVTDSNPLLRSLHDRMPVILRPQDYGLWLDRSARPGQLLPLLKSYSEDELELCPVSRNVNRPENEGPALIEQSLETG